MTPLDSFFQLFMFILGLIFGSFFNVVGLRVPKKQSIITPPSTCPHCQRRLNTLDLVPIIGYLWRRGRCVSCGTPISALYPIVELGTGILFLHAYTTLHTNVIELLVVLTLISLCIIVSISDLRYTIIPNAVLLFFLPIFLILRLLSQPQPWLTYLIGAFVGFLILFLTAVIKPGAMGMGDVKLLTVLGFVIGWKAVIVTLFLSSLLGLIVGLVQIARGSIKQGEGIPFGPYLCAGALIAYYKADPLLEGYLLLFF